MNYVDGYLVPVPSARKAAYVALAARAGLVLKEYGACRVVECWSDEPGAVPNESYHAVDARASLPPQEGASFPRCLQAGDDEVVVFSWVEWPDRRARDAGMAAAMADPRMQFMDEEPIFDGKRLIAGGFRPVLDL